MLRRILSLVACVAYLGCPNPTASPDAAIPLSPDARVGEVQPQGLRLSLTFATPDGSRAEHLLNAGDRLTIDPVGTLAIHGSLPLRNHRLRLFDEAERVVESDDQESRSDPTGFELLMAPSAPLKRGHRYALVLDSQTPGPILDTSGKAWEEMRFELVVAGEREKPAPAPKTKRRRHR